MSINKNSAKRILNLLELAKTSSSHLAIDAWVDTFGIEEENPNKISFEVTRCLILLHEEVEYLRIKIRETDFSNELYEPFLDKIIALIGVNTLQGAWSSYEGNISPDLILSLKFFIEILPPDEVEIPEEEINKIYDLVATLEATLENSELSPFLIDKIKKHIENIKKALENYNIVGSKAFSDVMTNAYGEVIQNPEIFSKEKDSKEIKLLGKIWKKTKAISDNAGAIEKGISTAEKLSTRASEALEHLSNIIQ